MMKIFGQHDDRLQYITCGLEFFVIMGVFLACGWGLDSWAGTVPLFTIIGLSLGFTGALYRLILQVKPHKKICDDEQVPDGVIDDSTKPDKFNITLRSLFLWVFPPVLAITLFGVLPTWLVSGWRGVWASLVAVGVVLFVMTGTGMLTVRIARRGAGVASTVFIGSSLARIALSPILLTVMWHITKLPAKTMVVWMVISYIICLGLECIWIVRALGRIVPAKKNGRGEE